MADEEALNKNRWPSLKKNDSNKNKNHNHKRHKKNRSNQNKLKSSQPPSPKPTVNKDLPSVQDIKEKLDKRPKIEPIMNSDLFLINREIIPKSLLRIIKIKEAIKRGDAITLKDALEEFDVSGPTYYKYKSLIMPFFEATSEKIFTLLFTVEQEGNVLTKIVTIISKHLCEILVVNKSFPVNRISTISISFETTNLDIDLNILLAKLEQLNGVRTMEVMGRINSTAIRKTNELNKNQFNKNNKSNGNKNFNRASNHAKSDDSH